MSAAATEQRQRRVETRRGTPDGGGGLYALGADPRAGLDPAEVEQRRAEHGPNRLAEQAKEPRLARVPAPVPRPDAARPRRRGGRERRRAPGVRHGARDPRHHRRQRDPRPEPGGQGGREHRRAPEDARDQGARAAWGAGRRHRLRGARARRHRVVRGRRQDPGRRAPARGGDPRDRGGGAHRRERARPEVDRPGAGRRRPARRPRWTWPT